MKKALVTGGCGFIGSNIVRKLIEKGYSVTVYDNLSTGNLNNLNSLEYQFINADIIDNEKLTEAAKEIDVIFHLAANVGNIKSLEDPIFDSNINIIGTLNVLEAARKNKVKKVVYSSSAAIYGELLYQPIDETHPLEPESPYGVSKLAAEKHCLWFGRFHDIKIVCLRYFNVYGINQFMDVYGNVIPKWVSLIIDDQPIKIYGDGTQTRDFVNVIDVASANVLAAENFDVTGFFNIASGQTESIINLALKLENIFNKKVNIEYEAFRPGEVIHCKADISKATQGLAFSPSVDFDEGLKNYVEWMKKIKK